MKYNKLQGSRLICIYIYIYYNGYVYSTQMVILQMMLSWGRKGVDGAAINTHKNSFCRRQFVNKLATFQECMSLVMTTFPFLLLPKSILHPFHSFSFIKKMHTLQPLTNYYRLLHSSGKIWWIKCFYSAIGVVKVKVKVQYLLLF